MLTDDTLTDIYSCSTLVTKNIVNDDRYRTLIVITLFYTFTVFVGISGP